MVTGRSVLVSSGHVPSFVLCGLGAATLLPRTPRASDQTDTALTTGSGGLSKVL